MTAAAGLASHLEAFWLGMALHLWQSTLILIAFAILGLGLRLAPARYVTALVWMGLLKLAIPLSLLGAVFEPVLARFAPVFPAASGVVEVVRVALDPPLLSTGTTAGAGLASVVYALLTVSWIAGMAVLLARWSGRSRRSRRSRRGTRARVAMPDAVRRTLAAALDAAGIGSTGVELVPGRGVAAVQGLLAPRILLSTDVIEGLSAEELRAVLLHEESHRRRHDTALSVAAYGILVVFFFYPPAWWLVARLRATTEAACDESVLGPGVPPEIYARALARVIVSRLGGLRTASATEVSLGCRADLRARLDRIENSWRYRVMKRHLWLLAACGLVVVGSFCFPFLRAQDRTAPAGAPRSAAELAAAPGGAGLGQLVGIDAPVSVTLRHEPLESVFRALGRATSTRFRIEGKLPEDVSVVATLMPVRQLLERLARDHRLEYTVADPWTVVVRPAPREVLLAGVGDVTSPRLIEDTKVQPTYPADARTARVEATAIFQAVIRADGTVGEIELLRQTAPDYGFAGAAEEAIRQWHYEPATLEGVPVDVYFTIFVEFRLQ